MIETISHQEYYDETPSPLRYHHRKRQRQPGILRPTSHSSRRYVPCSLVLFGVPITVKTIFFGIIQISLPVSMCRMGYALELTFGDWILRVLMIFTLTLVLLLLLVDSTLSAGTNKNSGCRLMTTPAERKRKRRVLPPRMSSSSSLNASPYPKLVSFAKGTKFFRLPRPKSKRQILKEQQELQQLREVETTTPNNRGYPTLAGMTPPQPRVDEQESLPDWKRAHRLLRAAMRQDPPAWKHDERDAVSVGSKNHDEREDDSSTSLAKNLFCERQGDGFDADSERDDDDTGDNWSAHSTSMVEDFEDEDDEYFNQRHHKSHTMGIIDDDDDESMILFEDDDDDTYNETIMLGTHTCYSPLGASEGSSSLENELEEALEETIEHLSPTRLSI